MNCSQMVDIPQLDLHSKFKYEFIIFQYPWASITQTQHKLLAHIVDLFTEYNNGHVVKRLSEEALEGYNK